jgi:DNA replication regulator DPB11
MSEKPPPEPQVEESKNEAGRPVSRSQQGSSNSTARRPRNARLDNTAFITDDPAPAIKSEHDSQNLQPQASNSTSDLSYKSEPLSEINTNSPTRTVATVPAPSDHPNPRPPKEDISNAISDLLAKTKSTAQPVQNDVSEGRKRGRILGRAASNVSISGTSTPFSRATSVDSTATHGNPVEYPASHSNPSNDASKDRKSANARIEKEKIERFLAEGNGVAEDDIPPSTQLQYEDPESREYKERIMARLMGEKVDEAVIQGRRKMRVATIAGGEVAERPTRKRGRPPAGGGLR